MSFPKIFKPEKTKVSFSRLGLGTVQFGLDYGITNLRGRTSQSEVVDIIRYSNTVGLQLLDTASLYGSSELTIGKALLEQHNFKIITKRLFRIVP